MPTFSKVQGDYQRLRNAIYHAIELHAVVCFAVFVGLASIATNAVPLLLGEQWREAAGILRLFSLYSLAVALSALYHPALLASGGPGRYVFINVVCAIGAAAACLIGIRFGVETVVALLTVNFLGISALALLFLRQRIGLNVRRFCQPLLKPAAAAALMFVVVTLTGAVLDRIMPLWLLTTTQVIVGAVTYLTVIGVWAPRTLLRLGEMAVASMSRDAVPAPQTTAYVDASYQA